MRDHLILRYMVDIIGMHLTLVATLVAISLMSLHVFKNGSITSASGYLFVFYLYIKSQVPLKTRLGITLGPVNGIHLNVVQRSSAV